jgi:mitochondrial fusion and transport protein UGO1
MTSSADSPNPLRPYYKPPSIGLPEPTHNQSTPGSPPLAPRRHAPNSNRDIRELFSDLDYGDYLPQSSPSIGEMAKSLADRALWNYTATVMSQPFEVAKVVLQCYDAGTISQSNGAIDGRKTHTREFEVC